VHDELVAEAPDNEAAYVLGEMSRAMLSAGEAVLKPYGIPVEVEGGIGDTWADC
jgi:DNA polymerase I-like protein with 3'-5' exonuclease and polymerase domains